MKKVISCVFLFLSLPFAGCVTQAGGDCSQDLASISIIDRNGMTETVSSHDRLKGYEQIDFLTPQPFEKVLRRYGRDPKGGIRSIITSYYSNGQVKQYLEAYNGRAFGAYREWHENGRLALEVEVIGGAADLFAGVENTWIFQGLGKVWDEEGRLSAEIPYEKGQLLGEAAHYHPNGAVAKTIPYFAGKVEGVLVCYDPHGIITERVEYKNGQRHGSSTKFWNEQQKASEEIYSKGQLANGQYWLQNGETVGGVKEGIGIKVAFQEWGVAELQEIRRGQLNGLVKVFNPEGTIIREYHIKNGVRHGEEVEYFVDHFAKQPSPKLSVNWFEGSLQGLVRTWYPDGQIESQREMCHNRRQGTATAWYDDGSLMLVEEYDNDKLTKGKYLRKGERLPASQVEEGRGTAILFDSAGNFLRKITYQDGVPLE